MPALFMWALANYCVEAGFGGLALALIVAFHTFLRTVELLSLRPQHFLVTSPLRAVILLPLTKGGQRKGAPDSVFVDDPAVMKWLRSALPLCPSNIPIVAMSAHQFRSFFSNALNALARERVFSGTFKFFCESEVFLRKWSLPRRVAPCTPRTPSATGTLVVPARPVSTGS